MSNQQGLPASHASSLLVRQSNPDTMHSAPLLVNWKAGCGAACPELPFPADEASVDASIQLADLIDFSLLNEIFDNFLQVAGLPIAIIDLNARVLASSKWQRLCMTFHRAHEETLAGCLMSDTVLSNQLRANSHCAIYRCANGLTDCATPIIVDGVHVANLFTGQFLLEQPDIPFFQRQQERCGFDSTAYFEALAEIPIVSEQKIPSVLKLLRGLAQEIAQQSLANAKLKATTQMLQTIVNTVPHYVFWKDRNSRYLGCNQAVAQLVGAPTPREMVGKTDDDLPWRQFAHLYRRDDAEVMETGIGKRNIIEPIDTGDGTLRWMETSKVPLLDAQDRAVGVLGIFQDVTERKQAEAALHEAREAAERANEAKSRFLAAVSHDLRQPLAALSLYVGALEGKLSPEDGPLLANMTDCVSHLSELLSNLLDLSRLEAGVITPSVRNFDLDRMLAKLVSTFGQEARAKGIGLRVAYFAKTGCTDPVLFQRILANLIANAIRYTQRGAVLVGTRRRQGRMWVEVWDSGIGIAAEHTSEIFEEFRQLGNSERNLAKGSGLGLAIVARTAALLGLQLRVQSKAGKGSLFAVELPVGEASPGQTERSYAHRALRVALVEDNAAVAKALAYTLAELGHHVVAATSSAELLPQLVGIAPDIVISDYRLAGDEDGLGVIDRLRSVFGADLPAVVITGDTASAVIRRLADKGVQVHHKPIDLAALRTTMAELTGNRNR